VFCKKADRDCGALDKRGYMHFFKFTRVEDLTPSSGGHRHLHYLPLLVVPNFQGRDPYSFLGRGRGDWSVDFPDRSGKARADKQAKIIIVNL
jgi:hypothetical protein